MRPLGCSICAPIGASESGAADWARTGEAAIDKPIAAASGLVIRILHLPLERARNISICYTTGNSEADGPFPILAVSRIFPG